MVVTTVLGGLLSLAIAAVAVWVLRVPDLFGIWFGVGLLALACVGWVLLFRRHPGSRVVWAVCMVTAGLPVGLVLLGVFDVLIGAWTANVGLVDSPLAMAAAVAYLLIVLATVALPFLPASRPFFRPRGNPGLAQ